MSKELRSCVGTRGKVKSGTVGSVGAVWKLCAFASAVLVLSGRRRNMALSLILFVTSAGKLFHLR